MIRKLEVVSHSSRSNHFAGNFNACVITKTYNFLTQNKHSLNLEASKVVDKPSKAKIDIRLCTNTKQI